MDKRNKVYEAINGERDYQDSMGWKHKGYPSTTEELLLLEEYVKNAREAWVKNKGDEEALKMIRKIAGIAVRCMENNGVYPRN